MHGPFDRAEVETFEEGVGWLSGDDAKVVLARIETQLDQQGKSVRDVQNRLCRLDEMLRGKTGTDGVLVRIDRIEQREKFRSKVAFTALSAALGSIAIWFKKVFLS